MVNCDSVKFFVILRITLDDGSFDESNRMIATAPAVNLIRLYSLEELDLRNLNGSYTLPDECISSDLIKAHANLSLLWTDATVSGDFRGNYQSNTEWGIFGKGWCIGLWNFDWLMEPLLK